MSTILSSSGNTTAQLDDSHPMGRVEVAGLASPQFDLHDIREAAGYLATHERNRAVEPDATRIDRRALSELAYDLESGCDHFLNVVLRHGYAFYRARLTSDAEDRSREIAMRALLERTLDSLVNTIRPLLQELGSEWAEFRIWYQKELGDSNPMTERSLIKGWILKQGLDRVGETCGLTQRSGMTSLLDQSLDRRLRELRTGPLGSNGVLDIVEQLASEVVLHLSERQLHRSPTAIDGRTLTTAERDFEMAYHEASQLAPEMFDGLAFDAKHGAVAIVRVTAGS